MPRAGPIPYVAALDGVRAVCLLAVLAFHSDFAWMTGGFLGVSTFFTLSGFLITSIVLGEAEESGSISLSRFWDRRLRRLAPAALLTVGAVVASAPYWLAPAQRERLTADAIAAVSYLVNWRFVQAEYAYELIFTDPSPLQHFWSLAIEAQFYLVFPLFVGAVLRLGAGRVGLGVVLGLATVLSVSLSFLWSGASGDTYRIYYGSDTRAAEILIGSLAALWAYGLRKSGRDLPVVVRWLALPAALAIGVAWVGTTVESPWLYRGGFGAYALASAVIVLAATMDGPFSRALGTPWLAWVGRVSYGGYLYHWPVFLLLSPERTGFGEEGTFVLRVIVTLALAGVSSRWIEEPIRRGRAGVGVRFPLAAAGAAALVALLAVVMSPLSIGDRLSRWLEEPSSARRTEAGRRWAVFGDSMALSLVPGLRADARGDGDFELVKGHTELGCGVLQEGWNFIGDRWLDVSEGCGDVVTVWPAAVRARDVDVAIVLIGAWESRDWRLERDGRVLRVGDPVFDAAVRDRIGETMDALTDAGATVVWLTTPHLGVPPKAPKSRLRALRSAAETERQDRLNVLIREVASGRSGVGVVDLASAVQTWPGGEFDLSLRPDHTHFGAAGSRRIAQEFLGAEVRRAVDGSDLR